MDMRMYSRRDMARGRRGHRGRGMDYGRDYREHRYMEHDSRENDFTNSRRDYERGRHDYEYDRRYDMGYDSDMRREDYHHMRKGGETYYPIEAMGYFSGYYGGVEDYARSGRMRDYRYEDYRGHDYRDYADYGSERLERHEIDHWVEKLIKNLNPDEKEMLKMDKIMKKAQDMGIKFDKFSEDEFYVTVLMTYTDYKDTVGKSNIDMYVRLAKDWLCDEDTGVRYGEKLASYYDNVVEG